MPDKERHSIPGHQSPGRAPEPGASPASRPTLRHFRRELVTVVENLAIVSYVAAPDDPEEGHTAPTPW